MSINTLVLELGRANEAETMFLNSNSFGTMPFKPADFSELYPGLIAKFGDALIRLKSKLVCKGIEKHLLMIEFHYSHGSGYNVGDIADGLAMRRILGGYVLSLSGLSKDRIYVYVSREAFDKQEVERRLDLIPGMYGVESSSLRIDSSVRIHPGVSIVETLGPPWLAPVDEDF